MLIHDIKVSHINLIYSINLDFFGVQKLTLAAVSRYIERSWSKEPYQKLVLINGDMEMILKANLHKLMFYLMIFAPFFGAYSNAYAEDVEEVVVTGTATSDAWNRYYMDLLLSLVQRQEETIAGYIQAQREMDRKQHQAQQELSACLGRAGYRFAGCEKMVADINEGDVNKCGDMPGAGISVGVELSFGVATISAALDGEAKVQHCKDVVEANRKARMAGCELDLAERKLDCHGG